MNLTNKILISEKSENFTPETPASYYARQTSKNDEKPRKTRLGKLFEPNFR